MVFVGKAQERLPDTNARFLAALGEGASPPPDVATLESVVLPSEDADGLQAPGLRFGDPLVMAVLAALVSCTHVMPASPTPGCASS